METLGPFEFEVGQRTQIGGGGTSTIVSRSAGGFGAVYALESDDGKRVAVKTPRLDVPVDGGLFERFVEEALVWIDLPLHPFVLAARRVLAHEGRPYIEMEYVPPINGSGSSLAALLAEIPRDQAPNFASTWTIATRLIDALAYIERCDETFVHGDVKPANLLLKLRPESSGKGVVGVGLEDMTVLLSDFGMSRAAGGALGRNRLGDVNYLAPEALGPRRSGALTVPGYDWALGSKSADVYAVGCTIFELTLNRPWQWLDPRTGSLAFTLDRQPDPELLARLCPDVDLAFAELLARCLDPDPARRPQTYRDLRSALIEAGERAGEEPSIETIEGKPAKRARSAPFGRYLMEHRGLSEDEAGKVIYLILQSDSLQSLGEVSKAAEGLDEVDRMVPGLACIESSRASGYLSLSETEAARSHLVRAIEMYEDDPKLRQADARNYSVACTNLAQILAGPRSCERGAALPLAEKAVSLEPDNAKVQLTYGMALMSAARLADAVRAFASAEALDPSSVWTRAMRRCCDLLQAAAMSSGEDGYLERLPGDRPLSEEEERLAQELMVAYATTVPKRG
ncbi:MAG TPA: protein kinase [Solirubrobacterales bacterium]